MTSAAALVPPYFTNGSLERVRQNMTNTKHTSRILASAKIARVDFDPADVGHRAAYVVFQQTGKWVIHFYNELPYQSVVEMVREKLLNYFLNEQLTVGVAAQLLADHNAKIVKVEQEGVFQDTIPAVELHQVA